MKQEKHLPVWFPRTIVFVIQSMLIQGAAGYRPPLWIWIMEGFLLILLHYLIPRSIKL